MAGRIRSLIDKARGLLTHAPKGASDAVRQQVFDEVMFRQILDEAPAMQDLISKLNVHHAYTRDLVADVFATFFQGAPQVRDRSEMDPAHLGNHAAVAAIEAAPETAQTRTYTRHDKYGAAMATLAVAARVRSLLEDNAALNEAAETATAAQQQCDEQTAGLDRATTTAEAAEMNLAAAMGEFDGNGPLTEMQALTGEAAEVATAALAASLDSVGSSQQACDAAMGAAQHLSAEAQRSMQPAVRSALSAVTDQLAAEAKVFTAWGMGPGELEKMDFAERRRRLNQLDRTELSKFAKLLGRVRLTSASLRAKKVDAGRDEMYDVELSGRLHDVIAGEYALLPHRVTRVDFLIRLASGRLLTKAYRGVEQVGHGAIICVCDTSGSMKGDRDHWSKAVSLSLLEQARAERRDFVGIVFADCRPKVWHFPAGRVDLDASVAFVTAFLGGGTDFMKPMDLATDILEKQFNGTGKRKGDIVLITDDDCAVSADWLTAHRSRKERLGFRTFGISVVDRKRPSSALRALSDDYRTVAEFADAGPVRDLFSRI